MHGSSIMSSLSDRMFHGPMPRFGCIYVPKVTSWMVVGPPPPGESAVVYDGSSSPQTVKNHGGDVWSCTCCGECTERCWHRDLSMVRQRYIKPRMFSVCYVANVADFAVRLCRHSWEEELRAKLRCALRACQKHNKKDVILTVSRHGWWREDLRQWSPASPAEVATAYRDVISASEFEGAFERIVISFPENWGKNSWIDIFAEIIQCPTYPLDSLSVQASRWHRFEDKFFGKLLPLVFALHGHISRKHAKPIVYLGLFAVCVIPLRRRLLQWT